MASTHVPKSRSVRLKGFDYSSPGAYFVTIVTQGRVPLFGAVVNGEVHPSKIGLVVERCWQEIPTHSPHVELGSFLIMPNHVHGILIVHAPEHGTNGAEATAPAPGRGTI